MWSVLKATDSSYRGQVSRLSTHSSTPATGTVAWRAVAVYVVVAYAAMWLVCVPIWLSGDGLATTNFALIAAVGMWTPALASLVAARVVLRQPCPGRWRWCSSRCRADDGAVRLAARAQRLGVPVRRRAHRRDRAAPPPCVRSAERP